MKYTVIVPARYASERLPGKPLIDIEGMPMIQHVYLQAKKSGAERVVVATDHVDIERCVLSWGGEVCMTRSDHASGTDRLAEVVEQLNLADDAIAVNVQGDEPLIPPAVIDQVAANIHANTHVSIATVSECISDIPTYKNPNTVKVVSDRFGTALYFSRSTIPFHRDYMHAADEQSLNAFLQNHRSVQKHVGIYAYRVSLLRQFVTWPPSELEKIEKLEQLRAMENGHKIHVAEACEAVPGGVDTEADLETVRHILASQYE